MVLKMGLITKKLKRFFAVLLFFFISTYYFAIPILNNVTLMRKYEEVGGSSESETFIDQEYATLSCQFARLDPWDKSIINRTYHPRDIQCRNVQPYFSYLDENGLLHLNSSEFLDYTSKFGDINCKYKTFDRDPTSDEDSVIYYGSEGRLELGIPKKLDMDMVEVRCYNKTDGPIYFDVHAHPVMSLPNDSNRSATPGRSFAKPTDDQLSLLMLMMDSTSISVLKRHLPKTYDYIKNVMKFKIFNGFHKVGDNSFPNMVAALTGYRYQYEQKNMPPDIQEDVSQIYFDHWPLIWKTYAQKGYATVYNEDKAEWGLFRYFVKGFKRKPVDFYYHMYWYSIYLHESYTGDSEQYCFHNYPKIVRFLDIVKRHLVSMKSVLQFQYAFLTDLCHEEDSSEEERADEYMVSFFKQMYENGYFNKTVVLFYSDHGHRYTPIRNTLVGLLEERTPMFNIWFPQWFYAKYPHIENNLRINTVRLSSLYDVHETLHDIAEANFNGRQRDLSSRGLSQLYPIPTNRTCFQAGVPDHHCTCVSMAPLDTNSDTVQYAAITLKNHINNILLDYEKICRKYSLLKVIRAEQMAVNKKLAYGVARYKHRDSLANDSSRPTEEPIEELYPLEKLRVAIELYPNNAQFEGVIQYDLASEKTFTVHGDISRLNKFGNQSHCVPKKSLQKFCACTNA